MKALMGLMEDAMVSYKQAVEMAEELKCQIELAEKPWRGYRCLVKGQIDLRGNWQKSQVEVFAGGLGLFFFGGISDLLF